MSERILKENRVKEWKDTFCGLFVRTKYAERFLLSDPESRKVMEVRLKPCSCVKSGERFAIVCSSTFRIDSRKTMTQRFIVGILEFQASIPYKVKDFNKYYALHRVTEEEFKDYCGKRDTDTWYGWHVELVQAFETPLPLKRSPSEQWIWFSKEDIGFDRDLKRPSSFGSSQTDVQTPSLKTQKLNSSSSQGKSRAASSTESISDKTEVYPSPSPPAMETNVEVEEPDETPTGAPDFDLLEENGRSCASSSVKGNGR
eukprot:Skav232484  [mRNA]  locus=scaffold2877:289637:290407:+ [translate_table: standard]